jgi:protein SCO1/2
VNRKNLLFAVLIALIITGVAIYEYTKPPVMHGSVIDPPKQMPGFTLDSISGPAHLSDYRGKVSVIFFGFTNCKDICPATMAKMADVFTKLGSKTSDVRVVFISVDYKRDTPQTTAAFVNKFRPEFIGLTGSQAQIDQVTQNYGITYSFDPPDANGDYEMEHTASVMVLDRQGRLALVWSPDQQPDEIASDLAVIASK